MNDSAILPFPVTTWFHPRTKREIPLIPLFTFLEIAVSTGTAGASLYLATDLSKELGANIAQLAGTILTAQKQIP